MADKPGAEMPFLDHLEELRWRLIKSLAALAVGVVVGLVVVIKLDVIRLLSRPITPLLHGEKLVFTHPGDPFGIITMAAIAVGLVLALPVIIYQAWAFLSPALYQHEKKIVIPVVVGAVALFVAGMSLSYFVILPVTLQFLVALGGDALKPMITAHEYFDFAVSMSLAFGASFELPIVILALTALGIVTPQFLAKYRRHAVVLCTVAAAIITPGTDITSLVSLTIPLYLLYELSIALSYGVYRKRKKKADAAAAAEAAERAAERAAADDAGRQPIGLLDAR